MSKLLLIVLMSLSLPVFASTTKNNLNITINTMAGCNIFANNVDFGIINFSSEMINSNNRVLFQKPLLIFYQCTPNTSGSISTIGNRNIINENNKDQYFHYDMTYRNQGIHTVPYTFIGNGMLESVSIDFKIMNPASFGNGILQEAGIYSDDQDIVLIF